MNKTTTFETIFSPIAAGRGGFIHVLIELLNSYNKIII